MRVSLSHIRVGTWISTHKKYIFLKIMKKKILNINCEYFFIYLDKLGK